MDPTSKRTMALGAIVGTLLLAAGYAAAVSVLFEEDFTSTNGGLGCTAGNGINGYNNWVAEYDATALELAHCDIGDWPGDTLRKYLAILAVDSIVTSTAWAKHSFTGPTGQWDVSVETSLLCDRTWGTDMFAFLELVDFLDVGFKDDDYSLDVRDGSSHAMDELTLDCEEPYKLTVSMANATASNYDLKVVRISDSTTLLDKNYDTEDTTTPGYLRFGVGDSTSNDSGAAIFDEIKIRHQI